MMEPLKEMFNKVFYENLAKEFSKAHKDFPKEIFLRDVMLDITSLELNQRLRRTSETLKQHLPSDYIRSIGIMKEVIPNLTRGYTNLVFPYFVGLYGKDHFDFSLEALKYFTEFGSSEFAIREYLKTDFVKTINVMYKWADDSNHHVRRLASEGSRPRLPWSFKLDEVIKEPALTFPILEKLKHDSELYVRKSVANHLNDISKEHPAFVLNVIKKWKGSSSQADWILKHASRTLLKRGDKEILKHFGIKHNEDVLLKEFNLKSKTVKTGSDLNFSFIIKNSGNKIVKTRLEYALYFKIANGKLSKKVFKISERELKPKEEVSFNRKHSFKIISTRRYYPGVQKVAVVLNGVEGKADSFILK